MQNLKVSLFLAFKSIVKGNRWALLLIILIMSLSFVNLIFITSILAGVTHTLDTQLVNNVLGNVVIDPEENKNYIDRASQLESRIWEMAGVVGVAPHLNSRAFIEYEWLDKESPSDKGKSGTWTVIGIDPGKEVNVTQIHDHMVAGSYLDENDRDKIVLGIEIAGGEGSRSSPHLTLQGVKVGDMVRLTYSNGIRKEYEVKGIFQAQEIMVADEQAFVTRKEMSSILGRQTYSDRASQIMIRTETTGNEARFVEELKALGLKEKIRSWQNYGTAVRSMVASFDTVTNLVAGIGLAVAAIAMFIVIYIGVINRRRQIGILRAIGIKGNVIIYSYVIQTLFYAISGIAIGWSAVHFIAQPYFASHPLNLPLGPVILIVKAESVRNSIIGLVSAAILAGFIPVMGIIRQSIIDAIWKV